MTSTSSRKHTGGWWPTPTRASNPVVAGRRAPVIALSKRRPCGPQRARERPAAGTHSTTAVTNSHHLARGPDRNGYRWIASAGPSRLRRRFEPCIRRDTTRPRTSTRPEPERKEGRHAVPDQHAAAKHAAVRAAARPGAEQRCGPRLGSGRLGAPQALPGP